MRHHHLKLQHRSLQEAKDKTRIAQTRSPFSTFISLIQRQLTKNSKNKATARMTIPFNSLPSELLTTITIAPAPTTPVWIMILQKFAKQSMYGLYSVSADQHDHSSISLGWVWGRLRVVLGTLAGEELRLVMLYSARRAQKRMSRLVSSSTLGPELLPPLSSQPSLTLTSLRLQHLSLLPLLLIRSIG